MNLDTAFVACQYEGAKMGIFPAARVITNIGNSWLAGE
jgi:hypothetical protein